MEFFKANSIGMRLFAWDPFQNLFFFFFFPLVYLAFKVLFLDRSYNFHVEKDEEIHAYSSFHSYSNNPKTSIKYL